jgi:hypothetical protein
LLQDNILLAVKFLAKPKREMPQGIEARQCAGPGIEAPALSRALALRISA